MFRVKVRLVTGFLVLLLHVAVYMAITMPLAETAKSGVEGAVQRASKLAVRSQELHNAKLSDLAQAIADRSEFGDWVLEEEETTRRTKAFDAIEQFDKKLKEEGRKAHFLGIVDTDGFIVARDLDIRNMYKEKLPFARNVPKALKGKVSTDIWNWRNRMMRSAAAPIIVNEAVAGAVVISYDITSAESRIDHDQFGTEVALFLDKAIRASSLTMPGDATSEDATSVSVLSAAVLSAETSPGSKALADGKTSDMFMVKLRNEEYVAIAGPLPTAAKRDDMGFVVLASMTAAMAPVSNTRWMLLILLIGSFLILFGVVFFVTRHFINAEDTIELGVTEVLNGNLEYYFEDVDEFEGLANVINVMLARLLGRPEPGEDMEETQQSVEDAYVILTDDADDDDIGSQLVQDLANADEAEYHTQLFQQYVEARREVGLDVSDLEEDALMMRLRANENLLKAKFKCQMIRFVIVSDGPRISFKPIRIG